jgi:hypothetical protein
MTLINVQLVFDADDPDEIMRFWGRTLEYENDLIGMAPDRPRDGGPGGERVLRRLSG